MLTFKKPALDGVTQSRTALALFAATLLVGGSASEASAKSHHHHGHRFSHEASNSPGGTSDPRLDANASFGTSSGSGRSFS